jgi:hypothetical protein
MTRGLSHSVKSRSSSSPVIDTAAFVESLASNRAVALRNGAAFPWWWIANASAPPELLDETSRASADTISSASPLWRVVLPSASKRLCWPWIILLDMVVEAVAVADRTNGTRTAVVVCGRWATDDIGSCRRGYRWHLVIPDRVSVSSNVTSKVIQMMSFYPKTSFFARRARPAKFSIYVGISLHLCCIDRVPELGGNEPCAYDEPA